MREYLSEAGDVLAQLSTDAEIGISESEAQSRLATYGPNKLDEAEKDPLWKRFFAQMADPMVIMLIVAAFISAVVGVIGGDGDFSDVVIIMFVVIMNSILGVVQESKAEEALEALQEMAAAQSKVIREGKMRMIPSSELVPGDIILLEAGDAVPADCRVVESASMKVEEASLTGESVPVEKFIAALGLPVNTEDVPLGDRKNMCYMGSTVVYGRGRAVVVDTGMKTEMGKIADVLAEAENEQTPLQKTLAQLSKILTYITIGISVVVFLTGFAKHGSGFLSDLTLVLDSFMIAVALAVAAIPEGLVAVVTIVLSMGVTKMSHQNAIIRKLSAVETLGCTQVICSDKTGTLTQNRMTVVRHESEDLTSLVRTMALCSDAKWDSLAGKANGEPTEAALVADAAKYGFTTDDLASSRPRVGEAPFDSSRKMMSVVVRTRSGRYMQHTKGGPDVVLARCTKVLRSDGVVPMTDEIRAEILEQNKAMADEALRVMAAARRDWGDTAPDRFDPDYLEHDLTYVGLSGMIDPVRPEVKDAIVKAHQAGINVVMITGDHIDTAVAIAKQLGIVESRDQAITGAELDRLTDEQLDQMVEHYNVYARVQPEHKVRIVDAWKRKDKVVAMTGDGVNDAPSIKRADIGVGMGITGTDVTKNVADMVLADDNFATIVNAVEEGRRIYDNIRKTIIFLLSTNLGEVAAVFVASMMGFTVLEASHLLWINLITDSFPALALGMEIAEPGIMRRKPRNVSAGVFADKMWIDCIFEGLAIGILTIVSYFIGIHMEGLTIADVIAAESVAASGNAAQIAPGIKNGMTMAFLTLSILEICQAMNSRSLYQSLFKLNGQNMWLWGGFGLSMVLTYLVIETPLSTMFDFAEINMLEYGIALALAVLIVPVTELMKAIMGKVVPERRA